MRVLITTSGIGSRLGKITEYTNKCLVRVGDKPAISHIVEGYPDDTAFVITLGYYGDHVRDFLTLAYPNKEFIFFEVENYSGAGSSLLHSMSIAREALQCPFVFHACDAIVLDTIPPPDAENWILGSNIAPADQYRTLNISGIGGRHLSSINEKGEISFDLAYPGLLGINDYISFWKCLDDVSHDSDTQLSDCHVVQKMMQDGRKFIVQETKHWYDVGEPYSLARSRRHIQSSIDVLDKPRENVYILEDTVIKFFHNPELVSKRVARAKVLRGLVPKILGHKKNFFKYEYVEGNLFSSVVSPKSMKRLLSWTKKNMWSRSPDGVLEEEDNRSFYLDKTKDRILMYLSNIEDETQLINHQDVPPVEQMINSIDKQWLLNGEAAVIHGDFILDNIIERGQGFCFIDWRQDYAGKIDVGDIYYDLAKLNHNLTFNHELVSAGNYKIEETERGIKCDILCSKNLLDCQEVLHTFIQENGYDLKKVKTLTALIWINMSPLHEYPLNNFLFHFGKYNLYRTLALENIKNE